MNFFESVYEVVRKIPKGKVANYGTVARLCGAARMSRQVGWALHCNPDNSDVPCHRVVTKDGRCSPAFAFGGEDAHREMLLAEGVGFLPDGRVNMEKFAI